MASPGQKQGLCGHFMAGFNSQAYCAPCVRNEKDCRFCNPLSSKLKACLAISSYQDKKKKPDQKDIMQESDSTLLEPSFVIVIGVATYVQQASSTPAKVNKKCENSVECYKSTKTRKAGTSEQGLCEEITS